VAHDGQHAAQLHVLGRHGQVVHAILPNRALAALWLSQLAARQALPREVGLEVQDCTVALAAGGWVSGMLKDARSTLYP
jgi:hypothetical protein